MDALGHNKWPKINDFHWDSFILLKQVIRFLSPQCYSWFSGVQLVFKNSPTKDMNLAIPEWASGRKVILTSNALLATRQNSRSVDEGNVLTYEKIMGTHNLYFGLANLEIFRGYRDTLEVQRLLSTGTHNPHLYRGYKL